MNVSVQVLYKNMRLLPSFLYFPSLRLQACWYSIALALFETQTFSLHWIAFAKSVVHICVCVCVWIFFSIPLIYLSIFMSIQLCVGYCNFIKVLKSGGVSLSLFKIVLITLDPLRFPVNLGISLSISTQKPVRIWQRLHWLCTSVGGELIL